MTSEELEHNHIKEIAENYVNECWGTYLDLSEVDLVMAGIGVAKIISKEKEKQLLQERETYWGKGFNYSKDQLTNAKEIIKGLLESCFGYNSTVNYEIKARAEKFLEESKE